MTFPVLTALILRPMVREKTRTALTVAGIAVGVAVVVAIQLSNQSALRAFRDSVDAVAGRANYQIVGESGTIGQDVLLRLQPLWDAGLRFAPVIEINGVLEPSQQPILILGVDLLSDIHFRDYRFARILTSPAAGERTRATEYFELFRPDSVVIPAPFAREHGLKIGMPLSLNALGQSRRMVVRGILEARGPATAFNGSVAVCDIATAQKAFGLRGVVSRIDLLVPDRNSAEIVSRIGKALPPGARLERPSRRNERVEKMLRAFRVNLFALAGIALLVGMFLVYNTVLISILRRRRDVGIVKTIGVSPRQVFFAFLGEGLLFGVIGSALGILLGDALASGILRLIGRTINELYFTSQPEAVVLTPGVIALAVAVGVTLSLISAIQPSLEAARVQPTILIRAGLQQRLTPTRTRTLALWAALAFACGVGTSFLPPVGGVAVAGYIAVLFVVIGFSLLAPAVVRGTSQVVAAPMRSIFGVAGQLAAASLPASLRRTSVASAALSLAIGMMVAVGVMVGSFRTTVDIWINQTVSSDLWLRPSKALTNASVSLFPPAIIDDLKRVRFIAAIDPVHGRDVIYGDSLVSVGSGDFGVAARFGNLPMTTPRSSGRALQNALARDGVVISESFSIKFHKSVGEVVNLPTAHGIRSYPITGIYRDYSNDRGVVVMDRALYIRSYDDAAINTVVVYLRPGVDRDAARRELERTFAPKYHAFAMSNASIRREVMKIFDQTFMITYALLAVAIVVAVLGIVNTLAALILERTRELALLRVGGLSLNQLRGMMVLESALLGLSSVVVGIVMGYALSYVLIYVINKQSFGWTIEFHTPVALLAGSLLLTFMAAIAAGLVPARMASRIDLARAIKSE